MKPRKDRSERGRFGTGNKVAPGGARPNSGRKPDVVKRLFKDVLDDLDPLACEQLHSILATGTYSVKIGKKIKRVPVSDKTMFSAIRHTHEYRHGKPTVSVQVTNTNGHVYQNLDSAEAAAVAAIGLQIQKGVHDHPNNPSQLKLPAPERPDVREPDGASPAHAAGEVGTRGPRGPRGVGADAPGSPERVQDRRSERKPKRGAAERKRKG